MLLPELLALGTLLTPGAGTSAALDDLTLQPVAVASFGAARAGDWIYVIGGHVGETHHHSIQNLSHRFVRMNVKERTAWEELPGGAALQSVALVEHDGLLYRVGGLTAHNNEDEDENLESVTEFERFDPATKTWTTMPPLPEPRSSHDAFVLDDVLYVVGGWILGGGEETTWFDEAFAFDLGSARAEWERIEQPFQRRALVTVAHDEKLWVLGGLTKEGGMSSDVDVFDPATRAWSKAPQLPFAGFAAAACSLDGELYASGMKSALMRLDEEEGWVEAGDFVFRRFFHRMIPLDDGEIAALGGARSEGHVGWTEWLRPGATHTQRLMSTMSIELPTECRQRPGIHVRGDSLYLFGGNKSPMPHQFEPDHFTDAGFRVELIDGEVHAAAALLRKEQSMILLPAGSKKDPVLAIGGFHHDGEEARAHGSIDAYDPETDAWTSTESSLPTPLTQFAALERQGKVWVFGGLDFDPTRDDPFVHSEAVWAADIRDHRPGEFEEIATLPRPRRAFGAAEMDDHYYLVGGMGEGFARVEEVDVYQFSTGTWSTIPSPKSARIAPHLVAHDGKLYLIGGTSVDESGESTTNTTIEVYDTETGRWSSWIEELPFPLKNVQVRLWKHRLLFTSLHEQAGQLRILLIELARRGA